MNFAIFAEKMAVIAVITFMLLMGFALIHNTAFKPFRSRHNFMPGIFGTKLVLLYPFIELLTALSLISGAIALYMGLGWGLSVSLLSLVSLVYISLRNSGWRIDGKELIKSEIPNIAGFIGGAVSIIILIHNFK